ncbi:hypothetical protein Poli38472_000335 [Pythium oligandrum]|uniref:Cytochrome P450 n=1 Tax=Pythium oligandrum TaxID=41045 RepID=A0A8K1CCV3_PYTOL|nr:hypothetical protein Poli38472_000335 [Pythium oligandrum]|eukprot:TMW60293.1 hypothetical protein Poli38472_000335 [Pythium oligandrum]
MEVDLLTVLLAACGAFAVLLVVVHYVFPQKSTLGELAPYAKYKLPAFKHMAEVLQRFHDYHHWMTELCGQHDGRTFRINMITFDVTILQTPELYEDVLKTQFECFDKGEFMCDILSDMLGNGIFAVDGHQWLHQRKTASNLFTMRTLRDHMATTVQQLMPRVHAIFDKAVSAQQPLDLTKLLNRFTMEGFAKIGFGVELMALEREEDHPFMAAFDRVQQITALRFIRPRWFWKTQRWLDMGAEHQLREDIKVIDTMVLRIIGESLERRQKHTPDVTASAAHDIVSLFLDDISHDEKREAPFNPVFLRDIVVNFLIAGRDTTAQALSWFFYELSSHPEVEKRIRQELNEVWLSQVDDQTTSYTPTMEQAQQLTYLEAAVRETLRLHPSVPENFKQARHDTMLVDGTFVPAGSHVALPNYALGRMPHIWGPDATTFRPERWLDPTSPDKLIKVSAFKFNAFYAGPRMCLGINLALMEMKMFIASVLSTFHLEIVPDQDVTYELSLTLPMKNALVTQIQAL